MLKAMDFRLLFNDTQSERYAISSLFFLNLFFFTVLFSVLKQFVEHYCFSFPLTLSTFPWAFFFCVIVDRFISGKIRYVFLSCSSLFIALCILLTYYFDFYSAYDSLGYHKQPMFWLYDGGNLVFDFPESLNFYASAYPKASWIFSAELALFLGKFKCLSFYYFISGAALFFGILAYFSKFKFSIKNGYIFALFLFFNPVAISQLCSSYVDSSVGALSILVFLFAVLYKNDNCWIFRANFLLSSVLAINLKFSAFLIVAIAFVYLGLEVFTRQYKKFINVLSLFFVFIFMGVAILGFNPFITNIKNGHHIFYPLFGEETTDIMTSNTPKYLRSKNSIEKLFVSMTSKASNNIDTETYRPKSLFSFDKRGIVLLGKDVDVRINGFGSYFCLSLILSMLLFLPSIRTVNDPRLHLLFMVLASVLLNPESWWARYSVPIFVLPLLYLCSENMLNQGIFWKSVIAKTITAVLFVQMIALLAVHSVRLYRDRDMFDLSVHNAFSVGNIMVPLEENHRYIFDNIDLSYKTYDPRRYICDDPKEFSYYFRKITYCYENDLRSE